MEIKDSQDIIFFILFFVPGFIMLKVYGLLVAREKFDFSSGLFEAIAFSCINYAICSPLILFMFKGEWLTNYFTLFILTVFFVILIFPIVLVRFYVKILNSKWAAKNKMLDVHKSAWDFFFSSGKTKWIIVTLKSGSQIGGRYEDGSFASSFPNKDIYISEAWVLKKDSLAFDRIIDRTSGILILESEISYIHFFN